tara:strand:+ start:4095 stop:4613 length:519 start_codon:yes stop_codon:yes gene_type:complete
MFQWLNNRRLPFLNAKLDTKILVVDDNGDIGYNSDEISNGWHGGSVIKILPKDFVITEEDPQATLIFDHGTGVQNLGVKVTEQSSIWAFVPIPVNYKATTVTIYDNEVNRAVRVLSFVITGDTVVELGTGNCNTAINITDTDSTSRNYIAIKVVVTATSDIIYGGNVDLEKI